MNDCWIDLFEEPKFGGKLRRIFGPAMYTALRGAVAGVQIESAIAGAGAFSYFFESGNPEQGIWVPPSASIARLSDLHISPFMDSIRILDRAPQPHERGFAAFSHSQRPGSSSSFH